MPYKMFMLLYFFHLALLASTNRTSTTKTNICQKCHLLLIKLVDYLIFLFFIYFYSLIINLSSIRRTKHKTNYIIISFTVFCFFEIKKKIKILQYVECQTKNLSYLLFSARYRIQNMQWNLFFVLSSATTATTSAAS